jgi:hypothetical protein
MTRASVLLVLFLFAVSGCIHHRTGMTASADSLNMEWRTGVTMRRDVVAVWGNPHKTSGDVWIWQEWMSKGGKVKASYYSIGMTISNAAVSVREHRLTFGADGRLRKWEISESVPGGAEWSLWPW